MSQHWSAETSQLLQAYSADPVNNYRMEDPSTQWHQENTICGDDIELFVRIVDDTVTEISYTGQPSMFTIAAASLLAEMIPWHKIDDILTWTYAQIQERWFVVSPRRQRSAVSALLAVRNALHLYLQDGKSDTYEDLLS